LILGELGAVANVVKQFLLVDTEFDRRIRHGR
jgi:hypothetical protein